MIKAVAFDYGGVIEKEERDAMQEVADLLCTTKEDFLKVYFSLNHLSNTGKKTAREVLILAAEKFNASEDQIYHMFSVLENSRETRKLNLELVEIIKNLKNKNYRIGLLSNASVNSSFTSQLCCERTNVE